MVLARLFIIRIAGQCLSEDRCHGPIDRDIPMKFLGYLNRFISNFVFLSLVYYSLNLMEKYQQRAILAVLVLVYVVMRGIATLRSFGFFQRIERLETEAKRLGSLIETGHAELGTRRKIINEVAAQRQSGEMMSYMDLMFLTLILLLCIAKIVTD